MNIFKNGWLITAIFKGLQEYLIKTEKRRAGDAWEVNIIVVYQPAIKFQTFTESIFFLKNKTLYICSIWKQHWLAGSKYCDNQKTERKFKCLDLEPLHK